MGSQFHWKAHRGEETVVEGGSGRGVQKRGIEDQIFAFDVASLRWGRSLFGERFRRAKSLIRADLFQEILHRETSDSIALERPRACVQQDARRFRVVLSKGLEPLQITC